ncbi:MAG: PQQ-binding-like beta-propeller repeat protein [Dehalococcoidia bacterium]|nr:PQQ-binding-like beta-propeller repeat protein [Dehalococcoidia bacterium]
MIRCTSLLDRGRSAGSGPSSSSESRAASPRRWSPGLLSAIALALAAAFIAMASAAELIPLVARAGPAGDWPMFHYDLARSGANANESVLQPSLHARWTYLVETGAIGSEPAVANGVVYVGSSDGNLYALDSQTGVQRWKAAASSGVSTPAVANNLVYAGSSDGRVYALDALTGTVKWSYPTAGVVASSPAVSSGVVYFGSSDGKVYALDADSGAFKWSFVTGGLIDRSSPALDSGRLFIGSSDGKVYALDAVSGNLLWSFPTGGGVHRSSPSVANGTVYIGSYDGKVYALNAQTGQANWSFATGGAVDSSPAVANGVVYVGSYDGNLYAFDAGNGAVKWTYPTGSIATAPVFANSLVYVGAAQAGSTTDAALVALNATTGELKWSYSLPGAMACGFPLPAVSSGTLYLGACAARTDGQGPAQGRVYAFENDNTPNATATPTPAATATPTATPTPTPTPFVPHLSIMNVPSRDTVHPGEGLSYVVLLDNSGSVGIPVSMTDTIPIKTSYITGTLPEGSVYSDTTRSITWSGTVPPSLSGTQPPAFVIRVRVAEDISANAITNTVQASSGGVTVSSAARSVVSWRIALPLLTKGSSGW